MLVSGSALDIRKSHELSARQAQALMDLEVVCAGLGLLLSIRCRACQMIGDDGECDGNAVPHTDGTMTFSVNCRCSNRAFRGSLVCPPTPTWRAPRRIDKFVVPEVALTRPQMRVFQDAAEALHQLRLVYQLRCMACRDEDRETDGCWGARETNASQFVIECACTRRLYKGADVKSEV